MTIVEGPIDRHRSRLASRETGEGLTGTYSGGSLDRTESVPKRPREHRARVGLREASLRDKAVRSWSVVNLNSYMYRRPPQEDLIYTERFFLLCTIYGSIILKIENVKSCCSLGMLAERLGRFDRATSSKWTMMSVESTVLTIRNIVWTRSGSDTGYCVLV